MCEIVEVIIDTGGIPFSPRVKGEDGKYLDCAKEVTKLVYDKAKESELTTGQIYFDSAHPYHGAKKKLPCLLLLPALTNSLVCVVKDMKTLTLTYKLGVTNLDFTIGLTENVDFEGNKINDWFLPRTLRVKDKSIENSSNAEFVDFIFSKDASLEKYDTMTFSGGSTTIPATIKGMLAQSLLEANVTESK